MKKKSKKFIDVILDILIGIGIVTCVCLLIIRIFFVQIVVHGHSMNPNIIDGSKALMVRVTPLNKIERFDVVAANHGEDYEIIKRVIGLPNEKVELIDNELYINDEIVKQTFTFIKASSDYTVNTWYLGDNEYLLAGDNRPYSIAPVVKSKDDIFAKNGFSFLQYDVSSDCSSDYTACPVGKYQWYSFK